MRISDWSSDVCSSDLAPGAGAASAVEPPIASAAFPVGRDYPLRATPFWDVTLNDAFWAPKVARNADVTVPFEIRKLGDVPEGLNGGVLEAAIYIARSRPDSGLRAYVDRCAAAIDRKSTRLNARPYCATRVSPSGRKKN